MSSVSNLTTTEGPLWDSTLNHGPVVSVISWLLIVASVLTVCTRIGTRWAVVRQVRSDDVTIITALVRELSRHSSSEENPFANICKLFAIGQTIAVSLEAANGLGRDASSLSTSQLVSYQKVRLSQSKVLSLHTHDPL